MILPEPLPAPTASSRKRLGRSVATLGVYPRELQAAAAAHRLSLVLFRTAGPADFEKEESLDQVGAKINRDMTWGADRALSGGSVTPQEELTQKMWSAMEEVICPAECGIYSYKPEGDMDPLSSEGKVSLACHHHPTGPAAAACLCCVLDRHLLVAR